MTGLEPLMIGAMVGGTALNAAGNAVAGSERAMASRFEGEQYRLQEEQARTAAIQDETTRRRELTSSLETIQAIRSGRGVGSSSPTGTAILSNMTNEAEDDILTARANYASRADIARRASFLSDRKARTSLLAGDLATGESILGGMSKLSRRFA